ncbi:MAG: hypothetical protein PWR27_1949 [Petroclostridium sp.]|jgi:hypothetical protein|uniref:hypothetical protein n=1 Tax=Petroclostridium xylanilyticum TaxID=1792311 RepID=UPI000B97FC72|nr:hypothetical protein [Petroclostridium xylanilyticum]MBZ4647227.1 hypothetical protein [Clostridia bacterium]MDK2811240.1 hypothetical protein [Petroclostridium sp.]
MLAELTQNELYLVNGGLSDDYYFAQACILAACNIATLPGGQAVAVGMVALGLIAAASTYIDAKFDNN